MPKIKMFKTFYVLSYFLIVGPSPIFSQDLMCCSHASGSCRSVCEKISLVQLAADWELRNATVRDVEKFCSTQLVSFWECLNATFKGKLGTNVLYKECKQARFALRGDRGSEAGLAGGRVINSLQRTSECTVDSAVVPVSHIAATGGAQLRNGATS